MTVAERVAVPLEPDDPRHGTYAGYQQKCRCEPCGQASVEYSRRWRARVKGSLPDDDPRHGTVTGHDDYGCRCTACRVAHFRALASYYSRLAIQIEREKAS